MNIASVLGDTCFSREKHLVTSHLPLGANNAKRHKRNIVFHPARAVPFGRQAYHLSPKGGTTCRNGEEISFHHRVTVDDGHFINFPKGNGYFLQFPIGLYGIDRHRLSPDYFLRTYSML